ncbi:MAG: septum formation initiator family protein [Hyphomonadaceae bacterium]|nr:septum formation initiator family protein [Hyphomonadaceae bacterium]MBC6412509.1 septum formation initiator family protein [Hyphomonadaceae bacterium]
MNIFRTLELNWPLIAVCVFYMYLAVHALSGSQGVVQWAQYEEDIIRLDAELVATQSRRIELEARRDRLSPGHLDLDDLDIKAREYVFLSRPEEMTIWLDLRP